MNRSFIRDLMYESQGRIDSTKSLPKRTSFEGLPNYPIEYVDADRSWGARYDHETEKIEFDRETAEKLAQSRDTRHGADAISAALAHEAAHGWWAAAQGTDADLRRLSRISSSGDLGKRYDLGPVHVKTPKDQQLYERAIETLAAYYLKPDSLSRAEQLWAAGVLEKLYSPSYYRQIESLSEGDVIQYQPSGDYEDFLQDLEELYEVEYKYSLLSSMPFRGHPKRLKNLLRIYENKAADYVRSIAQLLEPVFEEWLDKHAITEPKLWARKRIEEEEEYIEADPEEYWMGPIWEWSRYNLHGGRIPSPYARQSDPTLYRMISSDWSKLEQMPVTREHLKNLGKDYLEFAREAYEYELEQWKQDPDREEEDKPEEPEYGENAAIEAGLESVDSADASLIYNHPEIVEMMEEWYEHYVFPVWFAHWEPQGIVKTRKRIENAYELIRSLTNVDSFNKRMLADINYVVNVAHQTGSMLEYVAEHMDMSTTEIENELNRLSELTPEDLEPWRQEMEEIGVDTQGSRTAARMFRKLMPESKKSVWASRLKRMRERRGETEEQFNQTIKASAEDLDQVLSQMRNRQEY